MFGLAFSLAPRPNISRQLCHVCMCVCETSMTHLESIDLVHITCLVVSSVQKDSVRVQPLVRKQGQCDFDRP